MKKQKNLSSLLLEAASYGFFAGLFVLATVLIEDYLTSVSPPNDFSIGYGERTIPAIPVFIGATLSVVFWNLLFGKIIKSTFVKWLSILVTSSVSALLIQTAYLIYLSDSTINQIIDAYLPGGVSELLGIRLMIKLFIILAPFTILFVNRHLLFGKIKTRTTLG